MKATMMMPTVTLVIRTEVKDPETDTLPAPAAPPSCAQPRASAIHTWPETMLVADDRQGTLNGPVEFGETYRKPSELMPSDEVPSADAARGDDGDADCTK